MRGLPVAARWYIGCAAVAAALCLVPAIGCGVTDWAGALALAALYALCEQLRKRPNSDSGGPLGVGSFLPVLLAGVFLLPAPLAALVAVPGALVARAEVRWTGARKVWHAAQLALACGAASEIFDAIGHRPLSAPQFPVVLLPGAAAAVTFCVVLAALDGGVLVAAERHPVRSAWRGLLTRSLGPHLVHGLAGLMMAVLWRSSYGPLAALLVLLPMYVSCWIFAQCHQERAAHQATIRALVQAVDIKDRYTRGHSERVGRASVMIARELGMAEDRLEALRFAGILHDVGKLGVPTRLLRKDGPLTPEERRVIELHPEYGHEIVRGIGFLGEARAAILHHHERLDGRGYPYGLSGHRIPEFARVVAVADAFDAMTSTRSYRRARPVPTAVAELRKCAGTQFDPRMVRALAAALERYGWHPDLVTAADADPGTVVPPVVAVDGGAGAAPLAGERGVAQAGRGNVPPPGRDGAAEAGRTGARTAGADTERPVVGRAAPAGGRAAGGDAARGDAGGDGGDGGAGCCAGEGEPERTAVGSVRRSGRAGRPWRDGGR